MQMLFVRRSRFLVQWVHTHRNFSASQFGNSEPLWHCPELGYRINPDEGVIFGPNGQPLKPFHSVLLQF